MTGDRIDAVALGSPHFSIEEFGRLIPLLEGRHLATPFYVCTGRGVLKEIEALGWTPTLAAAGVEVVADTCVVVTPILPEPGGVLMTNSGKFAHYSPGTIGYDVVYGSLEECVESAATGSLVRSPEAWS